MSQSYTALIPVAEAAPAPAPGGGSEGGPPAGIGGLLGNPLTMMILMFGMLYLLMIRPQQKKQKEHREMVSRLKAGDRVVTTSGIYGTVKGVKDSTIMLEVADKVSVEILRTAVGSVLGKEESGN